MSDSPTTALVITPPRPVAPPTRVRLELDLDDARRLMGALGHIDSDPSHPGRIATSRIYWALDEAGVTPRGRLLGQQKFAESDA